MGAGKGQGGHCAAGVSGVVYCRGWKGSEKGKAESEGQMVVRRAGNRGTGRRGVRRMRVRRAGRGKGVCGGNGKGG